MSITRETIASRVKAALHANGMEQQELARLLGIDPSGLSRALGGQRDFKSLEIALIADALNLPVDALLAESPPDRSDLRLAARRQPGQSPALKQALDRVKTLTTISELLPDDGGDFPLTQVQPRDDGSPWAQGEQLAVEVRKLLSLDDGALPLDLDRLASLLEAELKIDIALEPLPAGLDGLSVLSGTLRLALVSTFPAAPRRRWTLAHELGHIAAGDSQELLVDENLFGSRTHDETRANAFAAAFLMPAGPLREQWQSGNGTDAHVSTLLDHYQVSLDALAFRLHNVGLVNAAGRDRIRSYWSRLSADRARAAQEREGLRLPERLFQRAAAAYFAGELGVRPLAALIEIDPDQLLTFLQPDEQEAEALSNPTPLSA